MCNPRHGSLNSSYLPLPSTYMILVIQKDGISKIDLQTSHFFSTKTFISFLLSTMTSKGLEYKYYHVSSTSSNMT